MDRSLRLNVNNLPPWATALCVTLVSLVAISTKSLWIDEALTAVKAMQPTLSTWWQAMLQERTSDLQMPFYMFYMWVYEKIFGHSEWVLRLANVPWFVAGATAFIHAFPNDHRRPIALFVTLFAPFSWFYLDEARPYALVLSAALMVAASLMRLATDPSPARFVQIKPLLFSIVLLSGTTMLGMIWSAAALGLVPVLLPQLRQALRQERASILLASFALLVLALYYFWTLRIGARGGAASTTNLSSLLFLAYETLGFGGLGPGRLQMRSEGLASLQAYAGWLVIYGVVVLWFFIAFLKQRDPKLWRIALICLLPAALIVAVGLTAHWRVLGRHMAPLLPLLLMAFVTGFASLHIEHRLLSRLVLLLFCALTLLSCLAIRFAPRHSKDDYRTAAALAKMALARGQRVWWNAAEEGARYYGVSVSNHLTAAHDVLFLMNPTPDKLGHYPKPDLVIASKPDIYDSGLTVAAYLREHQFQIHSILPAFTLWQPAPP